MQPYPQIFTSDLLTAAGTTPLTCPTGQLGFGQNPSVVPYSVYRATGSTYASPKSLSSVCKVKRCYCKENCSSTTAQQISIFTNSSSCKLQELTLHPRPWANLKSQPFHTEVWSQFCSHVERQDASRTLRLCVSCQLAYTKTSKPWAASILTLK